VRALIVDDERPARLRLRRLLGAHADVEIAGEAANAASARVLLTSAQPDVIFLDVQMPGESGFDLLARLPAGARPQVVFVTAFDAYAVRAFEEEAIDYLLKPFRPERLALALDRVRTRLRQEAASPDGRNALEERLERLLQRLEATAGGAASQFTGTGRRGGAHSTAEARATSGASVSGSANVGASAADVGAARGRFAREGAERAEGAMSAHGAIPGGLPYLDRLTARVGDRVDVIPVREVLFFRAEDKYVAAHTATGSHLLTLTLDQLERELDPQTFARTHRSVLVNLDAVESIEAGFAGTYSLTLRNLPGVDLPVSRQRAKMLRARLRF
jgi:two-component system LytT family response regulator